jgi:hypothetical protein
MNDRSRIMNDRSQTAACACQFLLHGTYINLRVSFSAWSLWIRLESRPLTQRPLTQSVKKSKRETLCRLVSLRSLRTKKEVEMEDLTPPDHKGPPSHRRAPRQSR